METSWFQSNKYVLFTMRKALFNAKNKVLKEANGVPVQGDSIPGEGEIGYKYVNK